MASGGASAADSDASSVALRASGVAPAVSGNAAAGAVRADRESAGKCGTGFGPQLPTVDGLIAWNDGGAFDTAGAADVDCASPAKIKKIQVYGFFGAAVETFNVTVHADSPTGGSNEPDDTTLVCGYTGLTGAAGGQYPTHVKTKLKLSPKCSLPAGKSWISIQNVNAAGPWYWEMQDVIGGSVIADWVDRGDAFGSGCTIFDNDRYLVDCLGYPYPDFMIKIK
jgi:hypothetical protein